VSNRSTAAQMSFPRRAAVAFIALFGLLALSPAISQAASPAWKLLAVTGPTNLPPRQSEAQRITVEAEGGTYTLGRVAAEGEGTTVAGSGVFELTEGDTTATVLFTAFPFEVGDLVIGPGIAPGTTVLAASETTIELSTAATETTGFAFLSAHTKEVTGLSTSSGEFAVGQELAGEFISPGTTITGIDVAASTLTLSDFVTGEGTVALTGRAVSTPLQYDAPPAAVEAAVESIGFQPGSVSVTGGPGGDADRPYYVGFGGSLAGTAVDEISANGTELVGPNANVQVKTTVPGGPGRGTISVLPTNIGGADARGTATVRVGPLPPGIVTAAQSGGEAGSGSGSWKCPGGAGESTVTCTSTAVVRTLQTSEPVDVPVEIEPNAAPNSSVPISIEGAGAGSADYSMPVSVSTQSAPFGLQAFWAGAFDADGRPETQAGGHPYSAQTSFALNTVISPVGKVVPAGDPKDVSVDLPPGFLGDPTVTRRCPQGTLVGEATNSVLLCNNEMEVGDFFPLLSSFGTRGPSSSIYNDVPAGGTAAEFTTIIGIPEQSLIGSIRSSEDGGVTIEAPFNPNVQKVYGSYVALQGEPAAAHGAAFLDNPTDCAVQREESAQGRGPLTRIAAESWQPLPPGLPEPEAEDPLPLIVGCQALTQSWLGQGPEPEKESPSFSFQPSTTQASSPAGATAVLQVPQEGLTQPGKLRTSDLKKAVVTLPQGLSVNPSSANGLEACSETQVGFKESGGPSPNPIRFDEEPVRCPDGSKLGTFRVKTPLLEDELEGTIYLAAQEENPFHSLIALYLVVESERFGVTLKLPGEVRPDPTTGQLTATFDNNPQLPFEDLTLHFRGGGGRATLATPETCGHFETTGSLEPWSAENGEALPIHEAGFTTSGSCASSDGARPFAPSFEAGTTGTQAGAYSPLVIKVDRKDGEQELKSLNFTLPKGLTGKLAGIPYCPEASITEAEGESGKAEEASSNCPAASQIGTVDTTAGVGSEPFHVGGKVYLAGPYKGAPLSSVVVTPAVAGPFDLGDVVIRAPLFVDPETAEITAKSDPIPTILKGIPLKVRSVAIDLDRSGFTLNPTSCNVMLATASIGGSSGATASPTNRFQVLGCNHLKFKPKLQLSLKGSTRHAGHPALKAVLTYPKQGAYANIARAQVNLPHSEFIDQGNLDKTCTKPVLLAGNCPPRTIYGKAKAWTPLLEKPLEGPVFLVGGYGYKLPALVAELNGQIRVVLKGKVDSGPNKGIRNTFEAVPDAPVSRFVLEMKGGKKYSLLENSENLCAKPQRAIARFTAQNGLVDQTKPLIANQCGKKGKKKGGKSKPVKKH
jgi:hypothetical protein